MRDVGLTVDEIVLALDAADRVGGVLRHVCAYVVGAHAEVEATAGGVWREACHHRIVAVEHDRGLGRQAADHVLERGGDAVQLAVAVQLIAEEIVHDHHIRLDLRHGATDSRFVDLEDEHIGVQCAEQARAVDGDGGDALQEIRAGAILGDALAARLRQRGEHATGGRLAVAAADDDLARAAAADDFAQHTRIDTPCDQAGQAGAAAHTQHTPGLRRELARRQRRRQACRAKRAATRHTTARLCCPDC